MKCSFLCTHIWILLIWRMQFSTCQLISLTLNKVKFLNIQKLCTKKKILKHLKMELIHVEKLREATALLFTGGGEATSPSSSSF